jgi:hypothetical protein
MQAARLPSASHGGAGAALCRSRTSLPMCSTASCGRWADALAGLDGYGRAAVGLEVRHAEELTLSWDADLSGRVAPSL